jgi:hypothetical protein
MASDGSQPPAVRRRPWLRFSVAGLLFFVLCWAGMLVGMRVGRDRPRLNPDPLTITVMQDGTQEMPGLQGLANVHIDDITRGQVVLSVADDAGQPLAPPKSVREGEVVSFTIKGATFYVRVAQLENKLLGGDFGEFEISSKNEWPAALAPNPARNNPLRSPLLDGEG